MLVWPEWIMCVHEVVSVGYTLSSISVFLFSQKKEVANESTGGGVPFPSEVQQIMIGMIMSSSPASESSPLARPCFKRSQGHKENILVYFSAHHKPRFISPVIDLLVLCLLEILCHVESQRISGLGIQTDTIKNQEEGLRQADSTTY